jgi:hypothetical protein
MTNGKGLPLAFGLSKYSPPVRPGHMAIWIPEKSKNNPIQGTSDGIFLP